MYTSTATTFSENARDVERLIDFDRDVLDIMIMSLEGLKKDVPPQFHSFAGRVDRTVQVITNIRNNESLKSKYGTVCNQAVVLLVSHFASAVGDLFRKAVSAALDRDGNEALFGEELKLTFREIKDKNWNLKASAGDLLIAKKDLTFQDMQSTGRAFESYVGIQIVKDQRANNIILGQAARHVIVHTGARVTERMLKQVSKATPRTLKRELEPDAALVFAKEEVLELKSEMVAFVEDLVIKLQSHDAL
jgi:hypothetical protein